MKSADELAQKHRERLEQIRAETEATQLAVYTQIKEAFDKRTDEYFVRPNALGYIDHQFNLDGSRPTYLPHLTEAMVQTAFTHLKQGVWRDLGYASQILGDVKSWGAYGGQLCFTIRLTFGTAA